VYKVATSDVCGMFERGFETCPFLRKIVHFLVVVDAKKTAKLIANKKKLIKINFFFKFSMKTR
jgi:hypothetical protein